MSKTKVAFILGVTALTSYVFWFFAEPWLDSLTEFREVRLWLLPLVFFILLAAVLALSFMLLPQKRLKLAASALVAGTYIAVFGFHYLYLMSGLLIVLFHVFAIRNIHLEIEERLKIHAGLIMKRGVTFLAIPIFIALSFAYFLTPGIQTRAERVGEEPTLKSIVSNSISTFLSADTEASRELVQEEVRQYAIERAYDTFTRILDPYRAYFPPLLAFGLFLLLWGVGFILYPLILWTGMAIYWVLLNAGFVRIEEVDVKAQRFVL